MPASLLDDLERGKKQSTIVSWIAIVVAVISAATSAIAVVVDQQQWERDGGVTILEFADAQAWTFAPDDGTAGWQPLTKGDISPTYVDDAWVYAFVDVSSTGRDAVILQDAGFQPHGETKVSSPEVRCETPDRPDGANIPSCAFPLRLETGFKMRLLIRLNVSMHEEIGCGGGAGRNLEAYVQAVDRTATVATDLVVPPYESCPGGPTS